MKHLFTLVLLFITIGANAQTVITTEDFESYPGNGYICIQNADDAWRTFNPGMEGTTEDAKVKSNFAYTGSKSLYLKSTKGWDGGPTDILYDLPEVYTIGKVTVEFMVYINNMAGASWTYAGDKDVNAPTFKSVSKLAYAISGDGTLWNYFWAEQNAPGNSEIIFMDEFTGDNGRWIKATLVADLTSNNWEYYWDDQKLATYSVYTNQLGAINFFPRNIDWMDEITLAEYWVDDINVTYEPIVMHDYNALVYSVERVQGISGYQEPVQAKFRNIGNETINSYDVSIIYNGTEVFTETVNNVSVGSMEFFDYTTSEGITLLEGDDIELEVQISNINGNTDQDLSNNTKIVYPYVKANIPGKKILCEYTAHTSSLQSPAAYGYAQRLREKYPDHFIDICLHSRRADPKYAEAYYKGLSNEMGFLDDNDFFFSRMSSQTKIERTYDVFKDYEKDFLRNIYNWLPATIKDVSSSVNMVDSVISVDVTVEFKDQILSPDTINLGCMIRESLVTGTDKYHKQFNLWAGASIDLMGLSQLPSPIPAADMEYHNVGRGFMNGLNGERIIGTFEPGDTYTKTITCKIQPGWDIHQIEVVPVLFEGEYDAEYNEEWYYYLTADVHKLENISTSITDNTLSDIKVYPNPANNSITIAGTEVDEFSIYSATGQRVMQRKLSGQSIDVSQFSPGIYLLTGTTANGQVFSTKFIKK